MQDEGVTEGLLAEFKMEGEQVNKPESTALGGYINILLFPESNYGLEAISKSTFHRIFVSYISIHREHSNKYDNRCARKRVPMFNNTKT